MTAERLGERLKYIYGDMLISSGELSYLGCYDLSVSRQIPKKLVGEYGQAIQA